MKKILLSVLVLAMLGIGATAQAASHRGADANAATVGSHSLNVSSHGKKHHGGKHPRKHGHKHHKKNK